MTIQEAVNKFKMDIRDGAQALSLAADGVVQQVFEASESAKALRSEVAMLEGKKSSLQADNASLIAERDSLQAVIDQLREVLNRARL